MKRSVLFAEMRAAGWHNKPGTWDSIRREHNVSEGVATTAWNAGRKARARGVDCPCAACQAKK